ncbi:hypothetical protein [Nocardia aobensis]|uniref:hypothetical protein n=1 Tax=Nocardia aobensis TaxID=257277 RepID=UPI00030E209A|nr:hypothetical protein [Nocardia aobensis]
MCHSGAGRAGAFELIRHMRDGHHIGTTYAYTLTDLAGTNFVVGDGISDPQQ